MTDAKKPGRKLVPSDPNLTDAEKAAIKAVKAYETADKTIDIFRIEHEETLATYTQLLEEREQKRQVADAAIRAVDATFGPWQRFSEQKKYYPDVLYERLGEKRFLEIGGRVGQVPSYEINAEQIELAIAAKKIPEAIVPDIRKITPKFRAPKGPGKSE
jgi:ribosomal protein L14E/L6E/L27E